MTNRRRRGAFYEDAAAEYLLRQDCEILERNYHAGRAGEIDLIALDRRSREIVFAEVKYRRSSACGLPEEAVDRRKQETIRRCAVFYLNTHRRYAVYPVRFDVLAYLGEGKCTHYRHAF